MEDLARKEERQGNSGCRHGVSPTSVAASGTNVIPRGVWLKRHAATLSCFLACYMILGSSLNPYCSYGFIWRLSFRENPCWLSLDVITDHPYFALALLALFLLFERSAKHFESELAPIAKRITSLVDQWWSWIIGASICAIAVTALVVYSVAHEDYDLWAASQYVEITPGSLDARSVAPPMHPPIDFLFIDTKSVDALFNQIEPELIEKKRTIASSGKISAKGQIGTGPISAGIEGSQGKDSTGSYERIDFSPARRCLEVMQKVAESGARPYYTIFPEWHRRYTDNQMLQLTEAGKGPITKDQLEKLRSKTLEQTGTDEKNALLKEFQELDGLIFVKGQFIQSVQTGAAILTKEFAGSPRKISFRVVLPHADSALIPPSGNLTVFGRVTKPLGQDGIVEIRPFAIF